MAADTCLLMLVKVQDEVFCQNSLSLNFLIIYDDLQLYCIYKVDCHCSKGFMMNIETVDIEKFIHQFYHDIAKQNEAHHWLTYAQVSPNAWTFCWDLLQSNKPQECQFFGANTLHIKISKFWHELPAEQYSELKKQLMNCILTYAVAGPRMVLTRLCVALSCFIIRTLPDHWTTAISDIMSTFQPSLLPHVPPDQVLGVLMELLTVLPEEFQSMTLAQSFRGIVRNCLQTNLNNVLPLVQQILTQTHSSVLRLQGLRCLSSWVQFGIPLSDCETLITAVLNCISDNELIESAVEVITNIVIHPDTSKYPKAFMTLLKQLLRLDEVLVHSLQHRNMTICSTMYNMFVSIGESHSRLLLKELLRDAETKDNILKLVSIILQCSGAPGQYPIDETCSGLPFSFWYTLQDDIVTADEEKCQIYMMYFGSIYENLVDILLSKVMYPPHQEYQTWNSEEKEEFRCYRQDIGDTLMYCYNLLRERMLIRLHDHLDSILQNSKNRDVTQALEACLYAFQSVAESVDLNDTVCVPNFFAKLPSLPLNNTQVISTALDAIGAYAEWINVHPEVLSNIIPLLLMGLNNQEVAPSATIALKDISRDCQFSMQPFAEQILMTSQQVLNKGNLKSHEQIRLMSTVGYVASIVPMPMSMTYLNALLMPYLQELQMYSQTQEINQALLTQVLLRLNMFCHLLSTLDPKLKDCADDEIEGQESRKPLNVSSPSAPHPVLIIMQQLLPLLRQLGYTWKSCSNVTEAICELMKRTVTNLQDDASPIVSEMMSLLLYLFQVNPNVVAVDLLKQFILLFGKDESKRSLLSDVFLSVINIILELCQKGISENSDIAEVLFQLLAQLIKKQPEFLVNQNFNLTSLFHCAIAALAVQEAPTVKAAASFLVNFINYSREMPIMTSVVNINGEELLNQTLRCIGGESPRGVMDAMADILLALNKKYFDNMCHWMNATLNRENFPSSRITYDQKEQFIRSVLKERANKRKLQETVKEFTLMCRGLIGTEYAVQILPNL